jgi:peptidyl-prolyl cis-trans isomerase B (cyclophilin B)
MEKTILGILVVAVCTYGCGDRERISQLEQKNNALEQELNSVKAQLEKDASKDRFLIEKIRGIKARIVTDLGNIEIRFFPDKAPLQCFNFITRAESGFYNNTQFHRVIKGFMIQGGDPNSKNDDPFDDGSGKPMVSIPHEFNDTPHLPGVLSTARPGDKSAGAGSQFFIMHGTKSHLDGLYTAFGEVIKGMDVVNMIASVNTNKSDPRLRDRPIKPISVRKILLYK